MDSDVLQKNWDNICEIVKGYSNIDPSQINAFFSRLQPQAMSDGFFMLTADNDFIRKWIEKHYVSVIKQALFDINGIPYTVVIEVDSSQSTNNQQDEFREEKKPEPLKDLDLKVDRENHKTTQPINKMPSVQEFSKDEMNSFKEAMSIGLKPYSTLTFENFVIGDSNKVAYSMAVAVAEMPGKSTLNPLFIYGKSGLGKTHLLRAIQNYIIESLPHIRTIYVDSAELLSDYMEASAAHDKEKSSYKNFKTKYEDADVLLIDDVQYLQGKKQTLDIVFQIFNKLTGQGKQIVLSADRAPKNIDVDERYISRFSSGGISDIQPPEIETKLGIVKSFIAEYKMNDNHFSFAIPEDIQTYIAENSSSNIRELKSAVTKVIYQMTYFNQPDIRLDDVRKLLENHFSGGPSKKLTVSDIQKEVENFYKISHAELIGKKRSRNIVYARQVSVYLCRQLLDIPLNDIGKQFNKDHSTVLYSVNNVEEKLNDNRELREEIETIKQILREL